MTASVIVVTLNRPDYVRRCLECLVAQTLQPSEVIVVDASSDTLTRQVVHAFPGVLYLRNEEGYGRMTASRNIGVKAARGEIIAFLDDDAFADSGWLEELVSTYKDPSIGAVGGRALTNQPGESRLGVGEIGRLWPHGGVTAYFAADPGEVIEVDHVMGCNMSFRRQVIARLGGFREDCIGISGVREDTDMCVRVKRLGYRVLFNPAACVEHVGAPQVKGRRFDARYQYYAERNHLVLLVRNFGLSSGMVWRYLGRSLLGSTSDFYRRIGGAFARLGATLCGTASGMLLGIVLLIEGGQDPVRSDKEGLEITRVLQKQAAHIGVVQAGNTNSIRESALD